MNKPRRLRARPRPQTSGLEPGDATGLPTSAGTAATGLSALEQAIATSDDWVRLQEASPDGFMVLRPLRDPAQQIVDFECTYANQAVQRMLGPAAAQLRHPRAGRVLELLPWAVQLAPFVEVIETGESKVLQQPVQADGRSGWWRLVIAKFADGIAVSLGDLNDGSEAPATNGADFIFADHGGAEERLQESELRWRRLMDANVVGIVISDTERVIDVNQCFLDMVGYERTELVGEFRKVTLTPVEFAALDEAARQLISSAGAVAPFEKEFRRKDGTRVPVLITGARLREKPLSWIAFVMDLTERRRAEQQLRKSELRWRRLVESTVLGVAIADEERLLEANEVYLKLIGYTEQELKAGRILRSNLTPPEYRELDRRALEQMRETGLTTPYEKEYIRADGSRVPVLIGPTVLTESPLSIIALVLDLSEQSALKLPWVRANCDGGGWSNLPSSGWLSRTRSGCWMPTRPTSI
jgi:PAS domain S-box-containing protein